MYRLMQPEDKPAVLALWQSQRNESEEFAKKAIEQFAGEQNVYVAEENDEIAAVALAVPVTLQGRTGTYLYGLCGEGSLILAGLVDYLCAQQKLRGAGFTVAVPTGPEQAALLQDKGFAWAFPLRCLPREVERNLWSQAEFDSVTAKKLCELRERFWPDTVQFWATSILPVQPSFLQNRHTASISARRTPSILWSCRLTMTALPKC